MEKPPHDSPANAGRRHGQVPRLSCCTPERRRKYLSGSRIVMLLGHVSEQGWQEPRKNGRGLARPWGAGRTERCTLHGNIWH